MERERKKQHKNPRKVNRGTLEAVKGDGWWWWWGIRFLSTTRFPLRFTEVYKIF